MRIVIEKVDILQAWCILLNDKVSFRMQWPQFAELQVNGMNILGYSHGPQKIFSKAIIECRSVPSIYQRNYVSFAIKSM